MKDAFTELWIRLEPSMRRAARSACRTTEDAEDLLGEVVAGFWKAVQADPRCCNEAVAWGIFKHKRADYYDEKTGQRERGSLANDQDPEDHRDFQSVEVTDLPLERVLLVVQRRRQLLAQFPQLLELGFLNIPLDKPARARKLDITKLVRNAFDSTRSGENAFDRREFWAVVLALSIGHFLGESDERPAVGDVDEILHDFAETRRQEASPVRCMEIIAPALHRIELRRISTARDAVPALRLLQAALVVSLDRMHEITVLHLVAEMERLLPLLKGNDALACYWRIHQAKGRLAYHSHDDPTALEHYRRIVGDSALRFLKESDGVLRLDDRLTLVFEMGNRLGRVGRADEAAPWYQIAEAGFADMGDPALAGRAQFYQAFSRVEQNPRDARATERALEQMESLRQGQPSFFRSASVELQCALPLLGAKLASKQEIDADMDFLERSLVGRGYSQLGHRLLRIGADFAPWGLKANLRRRARRILHSMAVEEFRKALRPSTPGC